MITADVIATGIVVGSNGLAYFSLARYRAALERAGGHIRIAEQLLLDAASRVEPPPQNARDILPEYDEV